MNIAKLKKQHDTALKQTNEKKEEVQKKLVEFLTKENLITTVPKGENLIFGNTKKYVVPALNKPEANKLAERILIAQACNAQEKFPYKNTHSISIKNINNENKLSVNLPYKIDKDCENIELLVKENYFIPKIEQITKNYKKSLKKLKKLDETLGKNSIDTIIKQYPKKELNVKEIMAKTKQR